MTDAIVSLDIGGTNLRMGLVAKDGSLYEVTIVPTSRYAGESFVSAVTETVGNYIKEHSRQYHAVGICIGVPAACDKERRVVLQAPNVPGLDGQPIADIMQNALGLPVYLAKDVDLLLTYDLADLGMPLDSLVVGIYFGTGIGNSIYWNGQILTGKNGVAGELGHIPQYGSTVSCGCGNIGCLEPLGGGRRLAEIADQNPDVHISEVYSKLSDTQQVRQQIDAMAIAVATEVNILDPDYVVIGGGLPQMKDFPRELLLERIAFYARKPMPAQNLDIRFARPNQANGIIGAGIYGWRKKEKAGQ